MGQPEAGIPLHDASHAADCESQQAQGWHVQLDNLVLALISCDRYAQAHNACLASHPAWTWAACAAFHAKTLTSH